MIEDPKLPTDIPVGLSCHLDLQSTGG